ncbi:related to cytochrome P450 CYP3/CYP5/CYP6/CYP9 subfamilies [Phialocephala subalpina]|uniref:Related to cytochrome P450 CYP3/CYP5/CYP6/CYP9 subfamilies n=1 Tax=Phialocephala subalpina TaxID=576137 RepID=A0A1L7XT72_9HELO|nr:related to cytochrome P450 CYP3/CYP5/CYP6/CYP9 subfamilies [Phialocephala subalpina]
MMALVVTDSIGFSYPGLIISCFLSYLVCSAFYRVYCHPLSVYPGPRLWAISRLPNAYNQVTGNLSYRISELHEQYGPIVRTAPDELSYIVDAWQDIYGKPAPRNEELKKDASQFNPPPNGVYGLLMEPSDKEHARMRRNLSAGFSEKAMRDQEPIMKKYFDLLIQRLHENCEQPVDMVKWYNLTTFDVISDLTFGESFNCLEDSELNFWVSTFFRFLVAANLLGLAMKFYPLDKIMLSLAPTSLKQLQIQHRDITAAKLKKRLELPDPRTDFLSQAQKFYNTPEGMSFDELTTTAVVLIIAGSETTATLLSGVTYYLLANPQVLSKLTAEIRGEFRNESDITMISVNRLNYELAVLNEALRIYPASAGSLPRVTPPEGCTIAGRFVPGNTSVAVNHWSAYHSRSNFKRPYDFIPERWTGDAEFKDDNRKVLQPFSVGPRNCIGRNLAYTEMRVILAKMIWNFDMELCEESREWNKGQKVFLVYDKPPLMVKLKPVVRA